MKHSQELSRSDFHDFADPTLHPDFGDFRVRLNNASGLGGIMPSFKLFIRSLCLPNE